MALAGTYEIASCSDLTPSLWEAAPTSLWSLGRWGLPVNICGLVYRGWLLAFSAMSGEYLVTVTTLNWATFMFGSVVILSLAYYLVWARTIYRGPVVHVGQE